MKKIIILTAFALFLTSCKKSVLTLESKRVKKECDYINKTVPYKTYDCEGEIIDLDKNVINIYVYLPLIKDNNEYRINGIYNASEKGEYKLILLLNDKSGKKKKGKKVQIICTNKRINAILM